MKVIILVVFSALLSGCANGTLVIRGNMPGTATVARALIGVNELLFCGSKPREEDRAARTEKYNRETYVEVRHTCTR